ncbi:L-type lectin-domain containing receptor kinase IV.1 [Linum perenne]
MVTMFLILKLSCLTLLSLYVTLTASNDLSFTYNPFLTDNLKLYGVAELTSDSILRLTNDTLQQKGQAFYPHPVTFKNGSNGTVSSFSTSFVFAIIPQYSHLGGHGIAFVISPTSGLPDALPSQYLGLFNESNNGNFTNHVFAVELDTIYSSEFDDIDNNHVGIDINGLDSVSAAPAGYYSSPDGEFVNLTLISGQPMQVWVDYDAIEKQINVTLALVNVPKPGKPLISLHKDLSGILQEKMFIGFSSSTGSFLTHHYVLGWSFKMNGTAQSINISPIPKLPRIGPNPKSKLLTVGLPIISVVLVVLAISGIVYFTKRQRKFAEVLEDWEVDYGPHRFKFKDLYYATKGFRAKEELGRGGFGIVYRGVLPNSKIEIAVKRVSHDSRQGMRQFVAEIVTIGRLSHRNLVSLLGYCRRKGELLLVYDYMPNSSLDKYLYDQPKSILKWCQRLRIIKGVASGLFYLHEEWEQVVIHRDVKASNVLLDEEWNGRLGDFGLARLYGHGSDPRTTYVAGTPGYLAPDHARTGKATTSSDVFAFGAFLLEVACGRRPIDPKRPVEEVILVDWVFSCWVKGEILVAKDLNLDSELVREEVELVLKLGLFCSHSNPEARPSMRQVLQILEGDLSLPDMSSMELSLSTVGMNFVCRKDFVDMALCSSSSPGSFTHLSSAEESLVSGGR